MKLLIKSLLCLLLIMYPSQLSSDGVTLPVMMVRK